MAEKKKHIGHENAPYWYNTPMKDLDFEWSREEALELERYAEKLLKNAQEEEMLPVDRFMAHYHAKPGEKNADRKVVQLSTMVVYATRTLDSYANALKPIDLYHHPKLMVKAKIATAARFKVDYVNWANITYTEGMWGGHSKMVDYGNPSMIGDPPIKTREDLEKAEIPDPYEDGLYPGYLWANREIRRYYTKYKLPYAHNTSMCPGAVEVMQMGMMGWNQAIKAIFKDPDFAKAACAKANEWCKRFGRAIIDVSQPEAIYCCQFTGGFPLKGAEWVAGVERELALDLKAHSLKKSKFKVPGHPDGWVHLSHGYSFLSGVFEWYEVLNKGGALTRDTFDGGHNGRGDIDMMKVMEWHRDHDIYLGYGIFDRILEKGTIPEIEQAVKSLCEEGVTHRRFMPMVNMGFFAPPPSVDVAMAALKKYSKL